MRRYVFAVAAVALAVVLGACASKPTTAEFGKADKDAIEQLLKDFTAAYNAKDVAKVQGFFSGTATVMPPNRNALSGSEGIKAYYEERFKMDNVSDLSIEPIGIEGQGPLAYVAGKFSLTLNPSGAPEPRKDRGKVLWIVKKLGGRWLFEWQIMNSDLPAVVPTAPAK